MAGTPQPPQLPKRGRRPAMAIGAAVIVALVAVLGIRMLRGHDAPRTSGEEQPRARMSLPASSPSPTASLAVVPSPGRSTTTAHEAVAAAAPTAFTYGGHGFTVRADVCAMPYVRPLDPPGDQHHTVCWVQRDFGFAPGTNGRGTTYVLGHSWAEDPREVLNAVSQRAMRQVLARKAHGRAHKLDGIPIYPVTRLNGDVITLRTANGSLRYTVRDAYAVSKEQAGDIRSLMAEHTPGRLVLITCGERDHVDYDDNVIVEAYLTSSTASRSKA